MEWLPQPLQEHGLAGLVIGGLAAALVALWRHMNKKLDQRDAELDRKEARIEELLEQRAKVADKMIEAIRSRTGRDPRSVSPPPTSYSISTSSKRTRD